MKAVQINQIKKSYIVNKETTLALDGVSFDADKGEIFGIIGPDGAGKSSLFRILTTLLLPDSGTAEVMGYDIIKDYKEIRKKVGYMPGKFSLYQDLSVEENLEFFATIFNVKIKDNYHMIAPIYSQIEPFKNRKAGALSGGMKQKLALSCALIHKPDVLFLDEPTTGVDPVSRKEFWDMLSDLKKHGLSIIVSTPYMDEANRCDRIALIQEGKFLSINKPEEIIKDFKKNLYALESDQNRNALKLLKNLDSIHSCFPFGEHLHITLKSNGDINEMESILMQHQIKYQELKQVKAGIEDCFIELMTNP
ncbi:MAG: ABC transporter ATP-binding protein [Bacteroidia bacterium]